MVHFHQKLKMSQKEDQKENSQNTVNVSSKDEVKSHLQAQSQDRIQSQVHDPQVNSGAASQGHVLTQTQLESQNNVPSQPTVGSQDQAQTKVRLASQNSVSSHDSVATQAQSVSSQPIVSTLSQISSQRSVSSSQGTVPSQKRKRGDMLPSSALIEAAVAVILGEATSSEESQDAGQKTDE